MSSNERFEEFMAKFAYILFGSLIAFAIGLFLWKAEEQNAIDENRIYTMVVDVYYNDTPERHTYVSDGHEIMYRSYRGTNFVQGEEMYLSTTAPVKVVSNTYKEKK